jgi:hypothetical protein
VLDHLILQSHHETDGSVVLFCLYELRLDRYRLVLPRDRNTLRQRVVQADFVSGHSLFTRAYPAIFNLPPEQFTASSAYRAVFPRANDLQQKVSLALKQDPNGPSQNHINAAWTLEAIAQGTIDRKREGSDDKVAECLRAGDLCMASNWAMDDVILLRDLILFEQRYGYLIHERSKIKLLTRSISVQNPASFSDPAQLTGPVFGDTFPAPPLTQSPASGAVRIPPATTPPPPEPPRPPGNPFQSLFGKK